MPRAGVGNGVILVCIDKQDSLIPQSGQPAFEDGCKSIQVVHPELIDGQDQDELEVRGWCGGRGFFRRRRFGTGNRKDRQQKD